MSPYVNVNGEIGECPRCDEEKRRADTIQTDLELAEKELQAKRRRISQLQKEMEDLRAEEPESQEIREVCAHWIAYHPTAKCPPGGKRWEKVRARLKDKFTAERICLAIDVAHAFPYELYGNRFRDPVKGSKERVDLTYICRDETTVERLEKIGLGVMTKTGAGLPPARQFFAEAFIAIGDQLAEAGVPGESTLDRVNTLMEEWMKAPEKPILRVVA